MKTFNFRVHELWPKPIFENYIPVNIEWIDVAKKLKYERMSNNKGNYTTDKYILNTFPDLKKEILKNVYLFTEKYLKIINTKFYFLNSWIVEHLSGDLGHPHNHHNSLLSGVYYLSVPKDSGNINFIKGHSEQEIFPLAITPNYSEYNYANSLNFEFKVNTGNLIIFPSNLLHEIKVNKSNEIRYSLAFNVFCKGNFGEKESILKL